MKIEIMRLYKGSFLNILASIELRNFMAQITALPRLISNKDGTIGSRKLYS